MCGISGILDFSKNPHIEPHLIQQMADSLVHRGPDDFGIYQEAHLHFGHRRLSIIDLSRNGHQPMSSLDERYWIVYNGEIYNYLELRQDLIQQGYQFQSESDTEVLLNMYIEYGVDCVNYLNGMFAFAIWDKQEQCLFAARDHFGIKPFYYVRTEKHFAFASEIKALLKTNLFPPALNQNALADYLVFQFCLGDKTLFQHVKSLEPGHWLRIDVSGEMLIRKYWDIDFTADETKDEKYFEHRLLRLLEDAVRIRLRADVPVGAHLSGGLDSSSIACQAAALLNRQLHVYTGGFQESPAYDETYYAKLVAHHIGAHYHEICPSADDFVQSLPKIIYYMDEPSAGPGVFPQYFVSKLARENVKVVLGGQGGDELFGGYTRYMIAYLEELLRRSIQGRDSNESSISLGSMLANLTQLQGYEPLMRHFWHEGLFTETDHRYYRLIDRSESLRKYINADAFQGENGYSPFDEYLKIFTQDPSCKSYINRMTRFDLKTLLPALLHVEDRTSMAVSLESRVPLLDHRIGELVGSMPTSIKYREGRAKYIFRSAVQYVVPAEIYNRQDKMGFPVPLKEWYQAGVVRDFIHDNLSDSRALSRGLLDKAAIEGLLSSNKAFDRGLWGVLSLELWFQTFIDN